MDDHPPNELEVRSMRAEGLINFVCSYTWIVDISEVVRSQFGFLKTTPFYVDRVPFTFQIQQRACNFSLFFDLSLNAEINDPQRFLAMNCTLSFLDMYNKQIFSNKTGMMPMKRKCPLIEFKSRKGVDNKLKIVFEFDLMRHDWNNTYDPLRNDLARLQADGTNSDVVLKTPTREFKAHKLILSCRSPVFAAMFNHDTREQNENVVQIMDISDDVLEQLLAFIYTDLVPRLHEMTIDLLIVADKYDIKALKSRCESCIFDTVTIQNATELLLTADRANATKLRTNIKQFIIRRRGEFIRSNDYQELRRSHPELILEIFEQPTND